MTHDFDADTRLCKRCNVEAAFNPCRPIPQCFEAENVTGILWRRLRRHQEREGKIKVEAFPQEPA